MGLALTTYGILCLVASWLYSRAGPAECRSITRADLSLAEMGAIKRRLEAYRGDPSHPLALSGDEVSFLLADNLRYPVFVRVDGDEVSAELSVPEAGSRRCYNIDFRGRIEVDEGLARLVPSELVVGHLDVSGWLAGRNLWVDRADIAGEHAANLLEQLRQLRVVDGRLQLEFEDVNDLERLSTRPRQTTISAGTR